MVGRSPRGYGAPNHARQHDDREHVRHHDEELVGPANPDDPAQGSISPGYEGVNLVRWG
jgi:hypothetical protein